MVLRLLAPVFEHQDLDSWPQPQFDVRDLTLPTNNVRRDHHKIIKKIGEESITLLKNDGALPLKAKEEIQSSKSVLAVYEILNNKLLNLFFYSFPSLINSRYHWSRRWGFDRRLE